MVLFSLPVVYVRYCCKFVQVVCQCLSCLFAFTVPLVCVLDPCREPLLVRFPGSVIFLAELWGPAWKISVTSHQLDFPYHFTTRSRLPDLTVIEWLISHEARPQICLCSSQKWLLCVCEYLKFWTLNQTFAWAKKSTQSERTRVKNEQARAYWSNVTLTSKFSILFMTEELWWACDWLYVVRCVCAS